MISLEQTISAWHQPVHCRLGRDSTSLCAWEYRAYILPHCNISDLLAAQDP